MPEDWDARLTMVYVVLGVCLVLGTAVAARLCRRGLPRGVLATLLVAAALAVAVNGVFLVEVAAPRLIRLPYHHCPYDLVPRAPESLLAIALFFGGTFAVGWACVAAWLGNVPGAAALLPRTAGRLLHVAALCYLWSLVMTCLELALT